MHDTLIGIRPKVFRIRPKRFIFFSQFPFLILLFFKFLRFCLPYPPQKKLPKKIKKGNFEKHTKRLGRIRSTLDRPATYGMDP